MKEKLPKLFFIFFVSLLLISCNYVKEANNSKYRVVSKIKGDLILNIRVYNLGENDWDVVNASLNQNRLNYSFYLDHRKMDFQGVFDIDDFVFEDTINISVGSYFESNVALGAMFPSLKSLSGRSSLLVEWSGDLIFAKPTPTSMVKFKGLDGKAWFGN